MQTTEEYVEGWQKYGTFMRRLNHANKVPVTLKEAHARWKTWTRSILTDEARKSFKKATWQTVSGTPIIYSNDGHYAIAFRRDKDGRVTGVDTSIPQR